MIVGDVKSLNLLGSLLDLLYGLPSLSLTVWSRSQLFPGGDQDSTTELSILGDTTAGVTGDLCRVETALVVTMLVVSRVIGI